MYRYKKIKYDPDSKINRSLAEYIVFYKVFPKCCKYTVCPRSHDHLYTATFYIKNGQDVFHIKLIFIKKTGREKEERK